MLRFLGTIGHALASALLGALVGYGLVFAYDQLWHPSGWLFRHYAIGVVAGFFLGFTLGWLRRAERARPSGRATI